MGGRHALALFAAIGMAGCASLHTPTPATQGATALTSERDPRLPMVVPAVSGLVSSPSQRSEKKSTSETELSPAQDIDAATITPE